MRDGCEVIDAKRKLGFALRDASRRYTKLFERRADALGLTLIQCRALVYLADNESSTQRRLATLIEVEPMSLVRIVDQMETQGWVRRLKTPDDRRTRRLQITPAAAALVARIHAIVAEMREIALSGFSAAEREQFMTFLDRLNTNLSEALELGAESSGR